MSAQAPPATLVIFGVYGDLTHRLLMPSLLNLVADKLVGENFKVLGIDKRDGDDEALRRHLDDCIAQSTAKGTTTQANEWQATRDRVGYLKGDFEDAGTFDALKKRLDGNIAFYLASDPSFFGPIVDGLAEARLMDEDDGFRRIAIEKPFGRDLASARALNGRIQKRVAETQIYRVDHFLGKETVQNIMVTRFGNALIEAVWNCRYIDHVQITVAETVAVGTRGQFYGATGALRDMVPNHLFQLLAMIGMEPPNGFDAEAIRDEKVKLLAAVRPVLPEDAVRGRYSAGEAGGEDVVDFAAEENVADDSRTETYVALKVHVETWRWAGVPFYLRTGKALGAKDSRIVVQFRPVPDFLFDGVAGDRPPNRLILQIQPREAIGLDLVVKQPGPDMATASVNLDFCYADHFDLGRATGYETLLYDLLIGNQMLFQRADMIEAGWAAVQPVLDAWSQDAPDAYPAGGAGPARADALLERDGRTWHELG